MKLRKTIVVLLMGVYAFCLDTAEASHSFSGIASASALDSFRENHPVAMVFANIGVLALVMGVCAVAFAVLAKGPNDL